MKHLLLSLSLLMLGYFLAAQQTQIIQLSSTKSSFDIKSSTPESFSAELNLQELKFDSFSNENSDFSVLTVKDFSKPANIGQANLPVMTNLIEIPYEAEIQVKIKSFNEEIINLNDYGLNRIYPTQPSYSKSTPIEDQVFVIDENYYNTDTYEETDIIKTEILGIMRGCRIGRIEIRPYHYNPVENTLIIYNDIDFEVNFVNADLGLTEEMKNKYYSIGFHDAYNKLINYQEPSLHKDGFSNFNAPLKYVIVANTAFETTLAPFVEWKTKQGYNVIEYYVSSGTSNSTIKGYLQDLYDNATSSDPAPLYVLFIGDHSGTNSISAYDSENTGSGGINHITDLYYSTLDGSDYLADLYYGRISAESTTQLQNALDKIIPYEKYTIPSGTYLNNCLLVAGVDASMAHAFGDSQILYGVTNYFNEAHGFTNIWTYFYDNDSHPYNVMSSNSGGASASILDKIQEGIGFANYTAHCSPDGWADPEISNSDISNFNNANKYPFMIGNCCQSFKFDESDAFGEIALYTADNGAVSYIGASQYSYWYEDTYWGIGNTSLTLNDGNWDSHTYANTGLGAYDGLWHDNGEAWADWHFTGRQMIQIGNLAVSASSSTYKQYYWEIYHLSGDPSIMPYMTEPSALSLNYESFELGATSVNVTTESYTYVAISKDGVLLDAEWSGTGTSVTLTVPAITNDTYCLVGTKQDRAPYINESLTPEAGSTPHAEFIGTPTTVVVGGTVDFTDQSTNSPTSWNWSFDGGTPPTSPDQNPSIVYNTAGLYTVTLTVENAEGSDEETKVEYIEVVEEGTLIAAFSATPTTLEEGNSVNFTDESLGDITTWDWTFEGGSPGTSSDQNPTITYPSAGVYSVTLSVSDGTNSNEEIKTSYITVTEESGDLHASFVASAYTIIEGECINFNDQSTGLPTSWSWSFPNSNTLTSTNQHPTNICYDTPGIYDVVLQVQNSTEQDTYICEDCITVNPDPASPIANFEADILTIPVGGVVHFTNLSENGPFNQWSWTFEGGSLSQYNDSLPPPIAYMTPGTYDVSLTCRKTNSVQDIEIKEDYITVIPAATTPPVADFTANYTVIEPFDQINFIDLSSGLPYQWSWEFEGATTLTSNQQNPVGITYVNEGIYSVKLTVSNNFGLDSLTKTSYIIVSETDPCTEAPTADFIANPRLVAAGSYVHFQDLSTGYPTVHTWSFEGGSPSYSNEGSPTDPILFSTPGIYNITLSVNNSCGSDLLSKNNYIYVFSNPVQSYCDTLTTISEGETVQTWVPTGTWGFLAGHNGDNIKKYANYFNSYTFSQITGVIIPISYAMYGDYSSSVKFCIWQGNDNGPVDSLKLGEKRVYIRDLTQNQTNLIMFDTPIDINGPFYAGFEISYKDEDNNGQNDDLFCVPIVTSRGINSNSNDLYLYKSGEWHTTNDLYNFSSAIPIKPITCLVDIEQLLAETTFELYPNPSSGFVTLYVKDASFRDVEIEIFDALGRTSNIEINSNGFDEYTFDMQSYPEGLYFIRIKTEGFVINKKLILSK